ncbi:MAG: PAS domain S-box protein [Spirochaetaceae bacterium]|nr:MAG: PAS domain S-box protein [Spirochaetaceae bacterium]
MSTQTADEQLHRTIVENAGEAIIVLQNKRISFCNTKAVTLSGYSKTDIQRLPWLDFVHPDDREMVLSECVKARRRKEHTGTYSLRIHAKGGNLKWLELHHKRITWNGRSAVLAFVSDITERKRLEAQFLQAQKMEAVGRLAGGIAHDFNNVLTIILAYTELLEGEELKKTTVKMKLQAIREAASKASTLTQNLLAFSRKQHLEPKIIDLNTLVDRMQNILERLVGKKIELVTKLDNHLGSIHADANQLEQVILNLAVNSKDAMEDGGKLVIATENVHFSEEALKPKPEMYPGRYAMLSISDNGSGMQEETKSHLFEPFFTTKESGRGTGLGLATVYGIIKQSKGFIYVYSEPGKGTTFKLYFPRIDEKPFENPIEAPPAEELSGSETVLVLEDEQEVLSIIESMLDRKGYTVIAASSGEAAVSQCRHAPGSIDLLITDVGIPNMSGREVWETVKKAHPNSRVLFISGYPEDFIPLEDIGDGKRIFLQKPFGADVLLRRVREILNQR